MPPLFPALVLLLLFCLTGCGDRQPAATATKPPPPPSLPGAASFEPDSPKLRQIHVEPVRSELVPIGSFSSPGKVEVNSNRLSHVVLPVAGRVTSVLVKAGDSVRQGQPLLTIESADIDAAVSNMQVTQAGVTQANSTLSKAQMDLDREKDLFEHGAVPRKEVLNAEILVVQARAALDQARSAVEQARRRLEILGVREGSFGQRLTVHAPLSGKILDLTVVNGEFRNDLSAPVMTIADLSSVWVTSDVPETMIRQVRTGEATHIELTAYPGEIFHGRVTLIGDLVDPQTRTLKVRAELANKDGRLKPEMFGRIQLAEDGAPRPTVPLAAIIAREGKSIVWREKAQGVFEAVPVITGVQVGERVAILDGLKPTDRIVVDGVMLLAASQDRP